MSAPTRPHGDAGLQPERTALAWSRTAVSFLVAAAIMLRWSPHFGLVLLAPLLLCVALAFSVVATQRRRYVRQSSGIESARAEASVGAVLLLAVLVTALGLGALVVVLP